MILWIIRSCPFAVYYGVIVCEAHFWSLELSQSIEAMYSFNRRIAYSRCRGVHLESDTLSLF